MAQFSDLYDEWLDQELGSDDLTQLFTTVRRKAAINEGQLQFAKDTECLIRQASIALADNDQEKDLEAVITAGDYLWLAKQGIEVVVTKTADGTKTYYAGDDLPRRDIQWLNRNESGWRNASPGTPQMHYIREDGGQVFVGLYPAIDILSGYTAALTVPYVAKPTDMSADGDLPFTVSSNAKTILVPWHRAIAKWAAYLLEQFRKDHQRAELRKAEYGVLVADYLQHQRPKGGNHITFARNYRSEVRSGQRPLDWRRNP